MNLKERLLMWMGWSEDSELIAFCEEFVSNKRPNTIIDCEYYRKYARLRIFSTPLADGSYQETSYLVKKNTAGEGLLVTLEGEFHFVNDEFSHLHLARE